MQMLRNMHDFKTPVIVKRVYPVSLHLRRFLVRCFFFLSMSVVRRSATNNWCLVYVIQMFYLLVSSGRIQFDEATKKEIALKKKQNRQQARLAQCCHAACHPAASSPMAAILCSDHENKLTYKPKSRGSCTPPRARNVINLQPIK